MQKIFALVKFLGMVIIGVGCLYIGIIEIIKLHSKLCDVVLIIMIVVFVIILKRQIDKNAKNVNKFEE